MTTRHNSLEALNELVQVCEAVQHSHGVIPGRRNTHIVPLSILLRSTINSPTGVLWLFAVLPQLIQKWLGYFSSNTLKSHRLLE